MVEQHLCSGNMISRVHVVFHMYREEHTIKPDSGNSEKTNISAELAGGEQGLNGGTKAHDVEHSARR